MCIWASSSWCRGSRAEHYHAKISACPLCIGSQSLRLDLLLVVLLLGEVRLFVCCNDNSIKVFRLPDMQNVTTVRYEGGHRHGQRQQTQAVGGGVRHRTVRCGASQLYRQLAPCDVPSIRPWLFT